MEDLLTSALLGSTALTDLVGDRVHWDRQDDDAGLPNVTLHRLHTRRDYTLKRRDPVTRHRVQIDCDGATGEEAGRVRDLVVTVLDGLRTKPLQAMLNDDPPSSWEHPEGADVQRSEAIHRESLDVAVWHTPAA